LLAKIHIIYPQQYLTGQDYWDILERYFGAHSRKGLSNEELKKGRRTAKYLSILELQYLVDRLGANLSRASRSNDGRRTADHGRQIEKLRTRAYEIAGKIENGEARLKGLAKKILGVDSIAWSRDVGKLKRLLAVLEKIKKTEGEVLWD